MVVQAYRCSDKAVPCRENSNVDVVVRSTLRLRWLLGNWRLRWLPSPLFSPSFPPPLLLVVA
jgi:hypothetical protein